MTSQTFWWFPNQGCDRTNVLLNDNYDTVIENRISILAARGYKGLVLPPKPLKTPISGALSQPSFKDNGIFEVTVSCKWLRLTPTRGRSSILSPGTLTLLVLGRVASVQSEPGQQNLLIQQPLGRKRGLRQVSRPGKGRRVTPWNRLNPYWILNVRIYWDYIFASFPPKTSSTEPM